MPKNLESINPATGELVRTYPQTSDQEVQEALHRADQTGQAWRRVSVRERAEPLRAVAEILRRHGEEYAALMAEEMGKPLAQGRSEIEKCAWVCDEFAAHAGDFLAPEPVQTDGTKSFVSFQPLGVILAVMPWNFPFWQFFRCAAPALMAGNAVLLKHASNVPGCALAIETAFRNAGLPNGLCRALLLDAGRIEALIADRRVNAVTLTGSVQAGRSIAALAGAQLKKTVLELGGSDPYVVLEDCDLDATVAACVKARLINSGQSCIAAKRFLVVNAVREAFTKRFVAGMEAQQMGDPMAEGTMVGPLARRDLREELHEQVQRSVRQGARILTGGTIPNGPGWFYPPTVLADVRKGMPVFDEETFGPIGAIIGVQNEAEAIQQANDTRFGLGAAVFTKDLTRGERIAVGELEAGNCFVNDLVRSDPRLPFGGIKDSGYGRELSRFGIREFVNVKTVYIK
jgi:succinate-semialdehyde dehydrogenase / glutarate-semialdehyde dehydrogenase